MQNKTTQELRTDIHSTNRSIAVETAKSWAYPVIPFAIIVFLILAAMM